MVHGSPTQTTLSTWSEGDQVRYIDCLLTLLMATEAIKNFPIKGIITTTPPYATLCSNHYKCSVAPLDLIHSITKPKIHF